MTRILTALFDKRAIAERARDRLIELGVPRASIDLVDQSATASAISPTAADAPSATTPEPPLAATPASRDAEAVEQPPAIGTSEPPGFWARLRHRVFPPAEDRHAYEEGIRRGGTLLTASVEDELKDRAVRTLEEFNPVDLKQRQEEWRRTGWQPLVTPGPIATDAEAAAAARAATTDSIGATTPLASSPGAPDGAEEQVIPVVEEQLRVGRRETAGGSVRVHTYIVEEPVTENVALREERVEVERRPVTGSTSPAEAADALRERSVEVNETREEPIVQKEARVKEEVVVRKRADERVQQVKDKVRHTEVDVERGRGDRAETIAERERRGSRPEDRPRS